MRYIGSKQRLLEPIAELAERHGVRAGTVLDIFSGTAVVARHFKRRGLRVIANDRMWLGWVLASAHVVPDAPPPGLAQLLREIEHAPPTSGLITRQYSPAGAAGRMYFRPEHARRIDAALERLARGRREGTIEPALLHAVLACVLAAADRVANISGTYGAFLKRWSGNTARPLALRAPEPPLPRPAGGPCEAHRADALDLVGRFEVDLLYIDPPYNGREYCANYHVLEAIARRPFLDDAAFEAFEASIYGKTGLQPYERSAFCSKRKVARAFETLVSRARARHIIVSYSEEGLLDAQQIRCALARATGCDPEEVEHLELPIRRFRSDADARRYRDARGRATQPRRYRQLEGRRRDELHEWLFHARSSRTAVAAGR
ncbi:MAG: hypothetical protein D6776_05260 [Planctomycetota bacterium]|nr:MAG: hypothetical protein D6776_05260 [Planctomycetota bacterium]